MARGTTLGQRYRGLPASGRASVVTSFLVAIVGVALLAQVTERPFGVRVAATAPAAPGAPGAPGGTIAVPSIEPGARQMPTTATTTAAASPATDPAGTLAPAGYTACRVSMTDAAPQPGSYETVLVRSAPPDTPGTVLVHYGTQTNAYPVTTDSGGSASYVFSIGTARSGHAVTVDVTAGNRSVCSTGFTPR